MKSNRVQYVAAEGVLRQSLKQLHQLWNGLPTLTRHSARDSGSASMRDQMANVSATGNHKRIIPYKPNPSTACTTEEPQNKVKNSRYVTLTEHMAGQPGITKS